MKKFLFEQYGYYPKEIMDNTFTVDGWEFRLIETELNDETVISIREYVSVLNDHFYNKGPFIIKNKMGKVISSLSVEQYVLVSVLKSDMKFEDLIKFHSLFYKNDQYIELDKVLAAWKERIEDIENKLGAYLRMDSIYYRHNLDVVRFCIGLGINAMQYLSDIIHNFDNKLYGISLVHKRLNDLNSFDFFNPFNFIIEHPVKDICLLYQSDYISFEEFKYLLGFYYIDSKVASFVMARILYRVGVYDLIEQKRELDQGDQELKFNFEIEMYKIKKAYAFLKENYSIRPIEWIEDHP